CDITVRTLPDPQIVLIHSLKALEDDASLGEQGNGFPDIFNFPAKDGGVYRLKVSDLLSDDHGVLAAKRDHVRVFSHECEPQNAFIEVPGFLRVRYPNEPIYWAGIQHKGSSFVLNSRLIPLVKDGVQLKDAQVPHSRN